ncbi:hypothetical protein MARPO_0178s0006 [Marchantia polymorpha]|uniref:Uncharacterized protein n=1 Tax=Marchantia polymorpha TaxID=3197 RepID=A0A2R6W272_MARPO|nr:hypothetical protein MARPO_0178s0006 [Marchantia polymorpha]|eukprot:PTQ27953.1 hypothetical protein MARPO_0178s0006 [Marchantia polymorpha]
MLRLLLGAVDVGHNGPELHLHEHPPGVLVERIAHHLARHDEADEQAQQSRGEEVGILLGQRRQRRHPRSRERHEHEHDRGDEQSPCRNEPSPRPPHGAPDVRHVSDRQRCSRRHEHARDGEEERQSIEDPECVHSRILVHRRVVRERIGRVARRPSHRRLQPSSERDRGYESGSHEDRVRGVDVLLSIPVQSVLHLLGRSLGVQISEEELHARGVCALQGDLQRRSVGVVRSPHGYGMEHERQSVDPLPIQSPVQRRP